MKFFLTAFSALFLISLPAMAQDLSASEIAKRAEDAARYQGDDGRSRVSM